MYCEDIKECASTKAVIRELIEYLRIKSGNTECKASLEERTKFAHYDEIVRYLKKKVCFFKHRGIFNFKTFLRIHCQPTSPIQLQSQ